MGSVIGAFYALFLWNFKKINRFLWLSHWKSLSSRRGFFWSGSAVHNCNWPYWYRKKQNSLFPEQGILPCRGWLYSVGAGTLVKNAARYPAFFGNHCLYSLLVLRIKKKYYLDVHRQMGLTSSRVLSSVESVQKRFIVQIVNGEKSWL